MLEFVRPIQPDSLSVAVFDFDGTLSLIRAGWVQIMIDQMFGVLRPLPGSTESDVELTSFVTDHILNLNGRPTIYQMDFLVKESLARGGRPETAAAYTQQFLDALSLKSSARMAALHEGQITTEDLLVPGTRALLTELKDRGLQLTLASGTAIESLRHEAALLQIDHFFEGRIYGPGEDPRQFSKLAVMQQTLASTGCRGSQLLGFGDGFTEIENVHDLGGIAIGCATDEQHRSGRVEEWKRTRLIQAGADVIVADYRCWPELSGRLFPAGRLLSTPARQSSR